MAPVSERKGTSARCVGPRGCCDRAALTGRLQTATCPLSVLGAGHQEAGDPPPAPAEGPREGPSGLPPLLVVVAGDPRLQTRGSRLCPRLCPRLPPVSLGPHSPLFIRIPVVLHLGSLN